VPAAAVPPTTATPTPTAASTEQQQPSGNGGPPTNNKTTASGPVLALVGVSLLWGTYAPSLRWLFLFDESLTPATLTAWRTTLSALAMLAAAAATGALGQDERERREEEEGREPPSFSSSKWSWIRAGAEIGLLNFLGTACQVTGVHATTATKAAFLGQATTALTPVLAALSGLRVTAVQWAACGAAVAGSALIAADGVEPSASSSSLATASTTAPTLSGGEPLVLLACVFYALSTVRMAVHAPRHSPSRLATAKTAALAALSLVWALGAAAGIGGGGGGEDGGSAAAASLALPPTLAASGVALAALAYSALGPGALATWLQASGQRSVPAAEAQVIFSLTPVWTALLSVAAAAVGVAGASAAESAMGAGAWAGSALVLVASLAVALEDRGGEEGEKGAEAE
jgi:drug/metabolite transporter (DMT)-like permease